MAKYDSTRPDIMSGSATPKSDAAEAHREVFFQHIRERCEKGKSDYGDSSFEKSLDTLISEIQQEYEDVAGWASIGWSKLETLRQKVARLQGA